MNNNIINDNYFVEPISTQGRRLVLIKMYWGERGQKIYKYINSIYIYIFIVNT